MSSGGQKHLLQSFFFKFAPPVVLLMHLGLHPYLPVFSLSLSSDPRQWPVRAVESEAGFMALCAQWQ